MARKDVRLAWGSNSVESGTAAKAKISGRSWRRRFAYLGSAAAVIGIAIAIKQFVGSESAKAQMPNPFRGRPAAQGAATNQQPAQANQQAAAPNGVQGQGGQQLPAVGRPQHSVMAEVNGQVISRDALAAACAERHGEEVLEGLINKRLIQLYCRNRGVDVTEPEIDAEIDRIAARFKIGKQQYLEMLEQERGINVAQYKRDILWPMLALRKLAASDLQVNEQEVDKAYQSQFGPAVQCRLIVVKDRALAMQIHQAVNQQATEFARLAMKHSIDVNSASVGGLIQPIYHHVGDPAVEQAVFALKPNGITPVIPVGNEFAILKCEQHLPARNVPLATVRDDLIERIKEEKLRNVAGNVFGELQKKATIQNIWNDPQQRAANPGIVATVNGDVIRYPELAEECLLRYGKDVLEMEIAHLLLQQASAKANMAITQQDLDQEIVNGARLAQFIDKNSGQPDVKMFVETVLKEQGITYQMYLRDVVWPSAALKKLTAASITVDEADLKKGYEANYGERVRVRAIVVNTMRQAQDVWNKARQQNTPENFGDLAAEFSIEPQSKALRGEVPPIGRHGGPPQLEKVAFDLQPGELSGVVQLGNQFVILRCEGRTEPVDVNMAAVREILYQDLYEKKLQLAMSQKFEQIRESARIDNFLAGTSQSPEKAKAGDPVAGGARVDSAVRPAGGGAR